MDDMDRAILAALQADARVSLATLARRLKVARSTVQARIERMEAQGTITGYTVRLGAAARANRIRATVLLTIEPRALAAILTRLKAMPEVEVAHTTSGRFDLMLQVTAEGTAALDAVLDSVGAMTGVKASETLVHLTTRIDRAG